MAVPPGYHRNAGVWLDCPGSSVPFSSGHGRDGGCSGVPSAGRIQAADLYRVARLRPGLQGGHAAGTHGECLASLTAGHIRVGLRVLEASDASGTRSLGCSARDGGWLCGAETVPSLRCCAPATEACVGGVRRTPSPVRRMRSCSATFRSPRLPGESQSPGGTTVVQRGLLSLRLLNVGVGL